MEKKLITIFTFGMLAISISNVLLSVGVVSLLLVMSQDTGSQYSGTGDFPAFGSAADGSQSATDINNMMSLNASRTNTQGANATASLTPPTNATTISGMPAAVQASYDPGMAFSGQGPLPGDNWPTPPSGQALPSGQMPSGQIPVSGQLPSSGQTPVSGQTQSPGQMTSSGQMPASGQYPDTSQSMPNARQTGTGTGTGGLDLSDYMGSFGRSTTPTPRPTLASTAWVNSLNNLLSSQYATNAQ